MRVAEPSPAMRSTGAPVLLTADDVHIEYRTRVPRPIQQALRNRGERGEQRTVHAVRGISLTLREGDALGIIGSNGAGKSSLLRGLAGLEPLAEGSVYAAEAPHLLGVGAALRTTWTGWETIEVGLRASGVRRPSRRQLSQEIADFTELGPHLDLPVGTYSRGMQGRLNFAISTAVAQRILFIDESLGGADDRFRARAEERTAAVLARSAAMIIVSHSMSTVRRLANRVIWMESGLVRTSGDPEEIVTEYERNEVGA